MQKARYLFALSCAYASAGCGTEVALAVYPAPADAGIPGTPDRPPPCASTKLTDRLSYGTVSLPEPVRYKRTGYFFGLPQDDRIAFSMANDHVGVVAWVNSSGNTVHVTPITVGPDTISRLGLDVPVPGTELSGLVALTDGFALLTRRPDPGELVGEGMTQAQATYLVRWQDGEIFAVALTGTTSIVTGPDTFMKRDFPNPISGYLNPLSGRLAFNGSHFGAYFSVRVPDGVPVGDEPAHVDKFVQVDLNGHYVSGWRWGCRQSLGNRLVAEPSGFVAFCMSDGKLDTPGLRIILGEGTSRRLVSESRTQGGAYAGGNFGSAVKVPNGYLVAWASRGVRPSPVDNPTPASDLHEPAVAVLDNNRNLVPQPDFRFLPDPTMPRDAVNVHAAPYGPYGDKVLIVWETIDSPVYRGNVGYSTGTYGGTHFRLVDAQGKAVSDEETDLRSIAPNGQDDIVQFPNGDVGWAYVPEVRDFQTTLTGAALPNLRAVSEIKFVRVRYCTP